MQGRHLASFSHPFFRPGHPECSAGWGGSHHPIPAASAGGLRLAAAITLRLDNHRSFPESRPQLAGNGASEHETICLLSYVPPSPPASGHSLRGGFWGRDFRGRL